MRAFVSHHRPSGPSALDLPKTVPWLPATGRGVAGRPLRSEGPRGTLLLAFSSPLPASRPPCSGRAGGASSTTNPMPTKHSAAPPASSAPGPAQALPKIRDGQGNLTNYFSITCSCRVASWRLPLRSPSDGQWRADVGGQVVICRAAAYPPGSEGVVSVCTGQKIWGDKAGSLPAGAWHQWPQLGNSPVAGPGPRGELPNLRK